MRAFFNRLVGGLRHAVMSVTGAMLAYLPAHAFGLTQAFWGAITAIAVVQTQFNLSANTARNQFFGGVVGGCTALVLLLCFGFHLWVYAASVAASVVLCWLLRVPTASQLSGITATIILLVPHSGPPWDMLAARLSEVGLGICAGIAVVWVAARLPLAKLVGRL